MKTSLSGWLPLAMIMFSLTACFELESLFVFPASPVLESYDFSSSDLGSIPQSDWEHVSLDPARYVRASSSVTVNGILISAEDDVLSSEPRRKFILHFPGNTSTLYNSIGLGMIFRALGYDSFGIEYRGYGISSSEFEISEESVFEDGVAAYRYLTETLGIPSGNIVIWGYSLGSAVATEVASRFPASALVLMSAMYNADSIGAYLSGGYFINAGQFITARLDNASKIGSIGYPVLFLHGKNDPLIPYENSYALRRRAVSSPFTAVEIDPDGDHMSLPGRAGWYGLLLKDFIEVETD